MIRKFLVGGAALFAVAVAGITMSSTPAQAVPVDDVKLVKASAPPSSPQAAHHGHHGHGHGHGYGRPYGYGGYRPYGYGYGNGGYRPYGYGGYSSPRPYGYGYGYGYGGYRSYR